MLNDNQKQTVLQRFHHTSVEDMTTSGIGPSSSVLTLMPINHSDNGDVASLPLHFTTTNQPNDEKAGSQACSSQSRIGQLSEHTTNTTGLPILFLRRAWSKAAELLTEKKVLPAPCSSSRARMVESKSMQRPHFVSPSKHDELLFECDDNCPGFIQRHICSHTVAVAEDNQLLNVYLEHFGKFMETPNGKRCASPNFSRLSMSGLPRGSASKKVQKCQ